MQRKMSQMILAQFQWEAVVFHQTKSNAFVCDDDTFTEAWNEQKKIEERHHIVKGRSLFKEWLAFKFTRKKKIKGKITD